MSRRRGEFEHRTSIFEGAYRAWSHLGGVDPIDLTSTTAADLDPLSNPHVNDSRINNNGTNKNSKNKDDVSASSSATKKNGSSNSTSASCTIIDSSGKKRTYPYEPLPRSGLAHPFVQAIISPWLGPDAEHDDIVLGLTTLRTWWQHRRKGESSSAKSALGTEKMRSVVEGYTRHFFNLAHCIVMNDGEQPPRTLANRIKECEKNGVKLAAMKKKEIVAANSTIPPRDGNGSGQETGGQNRDNRMNVNNGADNGMSDYGSYAPSQGTRATESQANYNMDMDDADQTTCCSTNGGPGPLNNNTNTSSSPPPTYGDPNKTPVVFVSEAGDIQIAMSVKGITCNNCVKIIETVLRGINGSPSPIAGLIDAAADRTLSSVLIKIEKSSYAKRIAYEAEKNLKMVGYDAEAKEMGIDPTSGMDLGALRAAFDVVAATDARDVFDWSLKCACLDNGIVRTDCPRHHQMNRRIFEAFEERERQVKDFFAGCGKKYGMACTCGTRCKCSSGKCCGSGANGSAMNTADSGGSSSAVNIAANSSGVSSINVNFMNNSAGGSCCGSGVGVGANNANVSTNNGADVAAIPNIAQTAMNMNMNMNVHHGGSTPSYSTVGGMAVPNVTTSHHQQTSQGISAGVLGGNMMTNQPLQASQVQMQVQAQQAQANQFYQQHAQAYQQANMARLNANNTQMLNQDFLNSGHNQKALSEMMMASVNQTHPTIPGAQGVGMGVQPGGLIWPDIQQSNTHASADSRQFWMNK